MQDSEITKVADKNTYDRNIDAVTKGILNLIYMIAIIICMPILYYKENGEKLVGLVYFLLLFVIAFLYRIVKHFLKKSESQRWAENFNILNNDLSYVGWIINSIGYCMIFADEKTFWFSYLFLTFISAFIIFFDLTKFIKERKIKNYYLDSNLDINKEENVNERKLKDNILNSNPDERIFSEIKLKEKVNCKKHAYKLKYSSKNEIQKYSSYNKDIENKEK